MFNHVSCPLFGSWEKAWLSNRNPPTSNIHFLIIPTHCPTLRLTNRPLALFPVRPAVIVMSGSGHLVIQGVKHLITRCTRYIHGRKRLVQLFTMVINLLTRQWCLTTLKHWYCMWRMHCKSQVTVFKRHRNSLDFIICSISGLWLANHTAATPQTQN